MARFEKISVALLLAFSMVALAASVQPSDGSPSPAPEPVAVSPTIPNPSSGAPAPVDPPTNLQPISSPPAPPPPDVAPSSSPTPTPLENSPAPAPSQDAGDLSHKVTGGNESTESSSRGMSGGRKAGIAIGVMLAAGLVVVGGFVYKKRRDNVRRSQYGFAARREIL